MQEQKCYERKQISTWACRDVNELYEKVMKVGSGTYGEVNKARLKSDHTQIVALKKIKDETETEGFPITALREIGILQQCNHPNIIKLVDIVTSKVSDSGNKKNRGSTYLVFEYMEHELLGLVETYHFTPAQVKCIMKQVLEGLAYLHSKNIIHRDIKSANILINNKGEVKIADFGLAKKLNPNLSGKLTQRVVTRWYRAPELLLGSRKYTTQIDVWALGCVFAELLIGKSQALFPAQKTPDQFEIICEKCGTPDEEMWPGHKSLPFFANMIPSKNYPRTLMQYMRKQKNNLDPLALDLLDKMLVLNPDLRITAKEALEHEYFKSEPLPCDPSEMPKIEKECHVHLLNEQRKAAMQQLNPQMNLNPNPSNQLNINRQNYNKQGTFKNYDNKPHGNYNTYNQNKNQGYHGQKGGKEPYNKGNQPSNTSTKQNENKGIYAGVFDVMEINEKEKEGSSNVSSNLSELFKNTSSTNNESANKSYLSNLAAGSKDNKEKAKEPKEHKNEHDTNDKKDQKKSSDKNSVPDKPKETLHRNTEGHVKRKTSHELSELENLKKKQFVESDQTNE